MIKCKQCSEEKSNNIDFIASLNHIIIIKSFEVKTSNIKMDNPQPSL